MRILLSLVFVFSLLSAVVFYLVTRQSFMPKAILQKEIYEDTVVVKQEFKKTKKRLTTNPSRASTEINSTPIDSLAVHKRERELLSFRNGELVQVYKVALGLNPIGTKEIEGDNKTPEGLYYIRSKNPLSRYHKSLGISYPNTFDIARARAKGKSPGGDVMIHGLMKHMNNKGKNHIKSDWTFGCVAVTDEEIDELYARVKVGTPIFITP